MGFSNERMRTGQLVNWFLLDGLELTPAGYPVTQALSLPFGVDHLIGFNELLTCKHPENAGVHFFLDDYQFERFWRMPERYLYALEKCPLVIGPDFSLYTDFPAPIQHWNHSRNQLLTAWLQHNGVCTIPTASWSDEDSFRWCFDGISKGGAVQLNAQDVGAVPSPAQPLPGEVVRILSVDAATGAVQTDTTPLPDLRPYVRSETVPTAATPGAVRADGQYGVAVRADATLTTVPATAAQLDRMTEAYAPLTPALLPYGVKKALTSAAGAAGWSAQEKAAALLQLGADDRFYSKAEADRKFGMGCTLPCATAAVLGGVKVGRGLTVSADGTLEMTAENLDTVLGFSLAEKLNQLRGVTDMNGKLVYTSDGAAGKSNKTMTVPDEVDYIVVRMAVPLECTTIATTGGVAAAAAADYGCTRIVRGGTAVAIVGGGNTYNLRDGVYCKGEALVKVSFAANGTVNIGVVDVNLASNDNAYPFNVEGYQYV